MPVTKIKLAGGHVELWEGVPVLYYDKKIGNHQPNVQQLGFNEDTLGYAMWEIEQKTGYRAFPVTMTTYENLGKEGSGSDDPDGKGVYGLRLVGKDLSKRKPDYYDSCVYFLMNCGYAFDRVYTESHSKLVRSPEYRATHKEWKASDDKRKADSKAKKAASKAKSSPKK